MHALALANTYPKPAHDVSNFFKLVQAKFGFHMDRGWLLLQRQKRKETVNMKHNMDNQIEELLVSLNSTEQHHFHKNYLAPCAY